MTPFELLTLVLGASGFLLTGGGVIVAITRAVTTIKNDISDQISAEVLARTEAINAAGNQIRQMIEESQKVQDHNFGEVSAALREKVARIEKKVYEVELYGRDNYAVKDDVRDIRNDIKEMRGDIKNDLRDLTAKIDAKV